MIKCKCCQKRIWFWQKITKWQKEHKKKFIHYKCTEGSRWDKLRKKGLLYEEKKDVLP